MYLVTSIHPVVHKHHFQISCSAVLGTDTRHSAPFPKETKRIRKQGFKTWVVQFCLTSTRCGCETEHLLVSAPALPLLAGPCRPLLLSHDPVMFEAALSLPSKKRKLSSFLCRSTRVVAVRYLPGCTSYDLIRRGSKPVDPLALLTSQESGPIFNTPTP